MSMGKTHDWISFILLGVGTVVALFFYDLKISVVFFISYIFGVLILSPDLDLSYSLPQKRAGILFRPYAWIFSHRGLSHSILIGPLTRIAYLLLLISPLLVIANFAELNIEYIVSYRSHILTFVCGIYAANTLHVFQDKWL